MMKKGYYRRIPIYFDPETFELQGRNWFYDILVDINLVIDYYIVDSFPIVLEDDKE